MINPAASQSIFVGVDSNIETLTPHQATTFAEHVVARALHRGLVQYNAAGVLGPGLAEDWSISANGQTYKFTLKRGLTWSDGSPLGPKHVVAGLKHALAPSTGAPFAAKLFPIRNAEIYAAGLQQERDALGVSVAEDGEVVINLSRRSTNFLHTLAHPVAMPLPEGGSDALTSGALTSGAYTVIDQTEDGHLTLQPVRSGSQLTFITLPSANVAWDLVRADQPFVTASVPIVSVPSVGGDADRLQRDNGEALYAYAVNMQRPPFDTIEVRHALSMAIRRPALMREVRIARALAAEQYVSPPIMQGLSSYRVPFAPLSYEEREAVAGALLSEIGYGVSTPLRVSLRIPEGDVHRRIADVVKTMWSAASIETNIVESPMPDHWDALERGDFDVAFMAWPTRRDTPLGILEPLSTSGGPWNYPRYDFADFSDRLVRADEEEEIGDRLQYFRAAEKAIIEDQTVIALFFYTPVTFVSPTVKGWLANAQNHHPLRALTVQGQDKTLDLIRPTLPQAVPSLGTDP